MLPLLLHLTRAWRLSKEGAVRRAFSLDAQRPTTKLPLGWYHECAISSVGAVIAYNGTIPLMGVPVPVPVPLPLVKEHRIHTARSARCDGENSMANTSRCSTLWTVSVDRLEVPSAWSTYYNDRSSWIIPTAVTPENVHRLGYILATILWMVKYADGAALWWQAFDGTPFTAWQCRL